MARKISSSEFDKIKKILLIGITSFLLGLIGIFIGLKILINSEANAFANQASEVFQIDKTEALLAVISSDEFSLKEKNNAIWALGTLKDKNALPALQSLLTGKECDHESELCQYEIKKAILKIKGDFRGSWQASN